MDRRFFAITLFIACMAILSTARASDFTDHFVMAKPPLALPAFTFEDGKGEELDIKNFKGHYVLLNIWATWCGPCVREMPSLDALAQKLIADTATPESAKAVTISATHTDSLAASSLSKMDVIPLTEDHEGLSAAEGFYKRHNLHHLKVFVDQAGEVPSILQINGLPTTLLIDPRGREIGRIEGATDWNDPETIAFLEKQMKSIPK